MEGMHRPTWICTELASDTRMGPKLKPSREKYWGLAMAKILNQKMLTTAPITHRMAMLIVTYSIWATAQDRAVAG